MAKKNILIRKKIGSSWEDLLPITAANNVKCNNGKSAQSQFDDMTTKINSINTDNKRLTKSKTVTGAINELFQCGNNVKINTVDALLQLDNSLQINKNSSWDTIINNISKIRIGKKWAMGSYNYSSGGSNSDPYQEIDLEFKPKTVIIYLRDYKRELKTPIQIYENGESSRKIHNYYDGSGGFDIAYIYGVYDKSFSFYIYEDCNLVWIAIE